MTRGTSYCDEFAWLCFEFLTLIFSFGHSHDYFYYLQQEKKSDLFNLILFIYCIYLLGYNVRNY